MKLKKELYTIISEHSHTDFDKVWADSDRDYWMTAEEAKEYGMIRPACWHVKPKSFVPITLTKSFYVQT